jgi:hypothetical protein
MSVRFNCDTGKWWHSLKNFDIPNGDPVVASNGITFITNNHEDVKKWIMLMHTGWCLPGQNVGLTSWHCYASVMGNCYFYSSRPNAIWLATWIPLLQPSLWKQFDCWFPMKSCHAWCIQWVHSLLCFPLFTDAHNHNCQERYAWSEQQGRELLYWSAAQCFACHCCMPTRCKLCLMIIGGSKCIKGRQLSRTLASLDHVQLLASLTRCDAMPLVLSSLSMSLKQV